MALEKCCLYFVLTPPTQDSPRWTMESEVSKITKMMMTMMVAKMMVKMVVAKMIVKMVATKVLNTAMEMKIITKAKI